MIAQVVCTTEAVSDLSTDGATLNGSATGLSASEYAVRRGFDWGLTAGGPYTGNWYETGTWTAAMDWSHAVDELESGVPVYYRSYILTELAA